LYKQMLLFLGPCLYTGGAPDSGHPWAAASALQDARGAAAAMQDRRKPLHGAAEQVSLSERSVRSQ